MRTRKSVQGRLEESEEPIQRIQLAGRGTKAIEEEKDEEEGRGKAEIKVRETEEEPVVMEVRFAAGESCR